jgi:Uma2 family endonuclease
MGLPIKRPMSLQEFLAWDEGKSARYEFIGGQPRLMTSGSLAHEAIIANLVRELGTQLRGKPCRALASNFKIHIENDNIRYPDAMVECGPPDPERKIAQDVRLLFEVLSPSTMSKDMLVKMRDYQTIATLEAYVMLWQDQPQAHVYRKQGKLWRLEDAEGLAAGLAFPGAGVRLAMADVYEGVGFPEKRKGRKPL